MTADPDAAGPAHTRRDTDPLALRLLTLLRTDSRTDRLLVWRALAPFVEERLDEKGQLALDAARLCLDDVCADGVRDPGKPLSEREYKAWLEGTRNVRRAGRRFPRCASGLAGASNRNPDPAGRATGRPGHTHQTRYLFKATSIFATP